MARGHVELQAACSLMPLKVLQIASLIRQKHPATELLVILVRRLVRRSKREVIQFVHGEFYLISVTRSYE